MAYNTIYEKLTGDENDPVGAFAYIIYKQQKVDYCKSFQDRAPTKAELDSFHAIASLDTSIAAYRAQGAAKAQAFLNASLDQLVERTEAATRQDTLYQKMASISDSLNAKRTLGGWVRDISGNLLVNLVSIFVLGALVLGYKFSGELQQGAEKSSGIVSPPAPGKTPPR